MAILASHADDGGRGAPAEPPPVGLFRADAGGRFVHVDAAFRRLCGCERMDAPGHVGPCCGVVAEDREGVAAEWRRAGAGGGDFRAEFRAARPDGTATWRVCQASAERDERGAVVGWVGCLFDVSDRKRAELRVALEGGVTQALAEARAVEDAGRVLGRVCGDLGWPAGELWLLEGDRVVRRARWSTPALAASDLLARDAGHGAPDRALLERTWTPGATPRVEDLAGDPLAGAAGVRSALLVPVVDVPGRRVLGAMTFFAPTLVAVDEALAAALTTIGDQVGLFVERAWTEAALRESEERHRQLYTNTPAMMHSIDRHGRLISVSNTWLRVLGYERDEVVGRRSTDFLTPASAKYAEEVVLPEYFARGWCADVPYQFVRKDGRVVDVLLSATCERDAAGHYERSLAVLVDVTERRHLEERLRQSHKMEALGRLAGGVAHDFNNLLTIILANTELVARAGVSAEVREHLVGVKEAVEHASSLTRQLLAFSRRQLLEPRVLDLNEIVDAMAAMLERLIGEDIRLETRRAPDLWRIKADRSQVEQVVLNLVVNARDAMPRGGRLTIETANAELDDATARRFGLTRPGAYVTLTVADTGVGMDEATRARIFEPFFTTKDQGKGTGLGLSTVYGVCEQSGGHVHVESEPGHGSRFTVFLPRTDQPLSTERGSVAERRRGADEVILLVEDEEKVRTLLSKVLQAEGYRLLLAATGEEALALAARHEGPIDLLITDTVMPGMGGAELAERLSALRPTTRVLFISGHAEETLVQRGAVRRGTAFLAKPMSAAALTGKVRQLIDAER